ncbi:hypothetical protein AKJ50_00715 [candidate division MSBL1 archaeon SCGC-AAA382A13]|uniref:2-phosphosulfolactate phosphatase n=1 Tax=candidate division MSBL1 archaeon SCGC-AAA382A13 TaxID=1698279 RepID=A0A133VGG2_9EURY|nr:hypothetical protein AKJ50_00715 [candidate division MSBL1 archaeon SCGC-AAA382A13]
MKVELSIGGPEKLDGTLVLVDAYKSSATIVAALDNGAKFVLPFEDEQEAKEAKKEWKKKGDVILAGEKMGVKIEDFDLNISPLDMTEDNVKNKIIIYKSDNLTRILEKCKGAEEILIGGLINSQAVGEYLNNTKPERVEIVACGTHNKNLIGDFLDIPCDSQNDFTMEDFIGAGSIIHHLDWDYASDLGLISLLAYENPDWKKKIFQGCIVRALQKAGLEEDIPACFTENISDTIPILKKNQILKLSTINR